MRACEAKNALIIDEYVGVMTLEGHFWVSLINLEILQKGIEGSDIEWRSNLVIIGNNGETMNFHKISLDIWVRIFRNFWK